MTYKCSECGGSLTVRQAATNQSYCSKCSPPTPLALPSGSMPASVIRIDFEKLLRREFKKKLRGNLQFSMPIASR